MEGKRVTFEGRLETASGECAKVHIRVHDDMLSMRTGRRPIGSWALDDLIIERISLFRFRLTVRDEELLLVADDPTGFASAAGAVVDLREGRFGLKGRLDAAQVSER